MSAYEDALAVLEALPVEVQALRAKLGLSLRAAATEIGVAFATVQRVEQGKDITTRSLELVLAWLHSYADVEFLPKQG